MAERVKDELIEKHHADIVVGPDAYMSLPDMVAQVECGQKAINVELSTTETYKDIIPQRICGTHIGGFHYARLQQLLPLLHRSLYQGA